MVPMDLYDADLNRRISRGSPGIGSWWVGGLNSTTGLGPRIAADGVYYQMHSDSPAARRSGWLVALKRLLKKKKMVKTKAPARNFARYDPETYAQNFDRGSFRLEPENLSQSFSVQFANPAGFLLRRA